MDLAEKNGQYLTGKYQSVRMGDFSVTGWQEMDVQISGIRCADEFLNAYFVE